MDFKGFISAVCEGQEVALPVFSDKPTLTLTFRQRDIVFYVQQNKFYMQAAFGDALEESESNASLLQNIAHFNLKRMGVLDECIFFNKESRMLFCRRKLDLMEVENAKQANELFEDFLLNVEVIEDRFFKKDKKL